MSKQDSQYEDSDQQLKSNGEPFTHIGEVKITQTMFGKVKIEVVGQPDNQSRSWLLPVVSVIVIAAVAWFGWVAMHNTETLPSPVTLQTENSSTPSEAVKSNDAPRDETNSLAASKKSVPQQLKGKEKVVAENPLASKPPRSGKSQVAVPETNSSSMKEAEAQQQTQEPPSSQPEAPAVTPPVTQP